jgi:hypothetical protein
MFVMAYCTKRLANDEFKAMLYAALPQLIVSQDDLFTFIEDYFRFTGSKAGKIKGNSQILFLVTSFWISLKVVDVV